MLDMHGNNDTKAPHNDVSEHYNVHEILKGMYYILNRIMYNHVVFKVYTY